MFTPAAEYPTDKAALYALLCAQLTALTEDEQKVIPNLANASALLANALPDLNWAGFYMVYGTELVLGPFQGKPACIRIPFGRGVCGTAAAENATQVVANVHDFPGHIACDCASNAEIVIPLRARGKVVAVLDIDSPVFSRFDDQDRAGLEAFCALLECACNWEEV